MSEYHIPVLLQESLEALLIQPDGVYVDVTFGAGGHSRSILKQLDANGHLYGFDQDDDAVQNAISDPRFTFVQANFRYVQRFLRLYKVYKVDGILMDLGVSSHQFDRAERGFSFRFDAELDMRMNQSAAKDAKTVLNTYSADRLQEVFSKYGEVRNARTLARKIIEKRKQSPFTTTFRFNDFLDVVRLGDGLKYKMQVYQAIRIEVNDEMNALSEAISAAIEVLRPGGRLVIISYHSIEDRMAKNYIKAGNESGKLVKDDFGKILRPLKAVNKKIIVPSEEEMQRNGRARSAKLRIAEKV